MSISHVVVVISSLILTVSAWHFSKTQIETRIEARFDASVQNTIGLLRDRMERYEDALWSGVAAINTQDGEITHDNWKIFADGLRLREKYPGINGIGVIYFVPNEDLPDFVTEQRKQQANFQTKPPHSYPLSMPITHIEPLEINRQALGLDVAHETNRRLAALASRDTGTAQITGPIVLVQDENHTPGFLFYAPIYEGEKPSTPQQRAERAVGAVYAPFIVNKLMDGLLPDANRDVLFSIRDTDTLIYDEINTDDALSDPDPMYQKTVKVALYGRIWELDLETSLIFRNQNTYVQPNMILFSGLMIEALIIAILTLLTLSNRKAHDHATKVTRALRIEKQKLAKTNEELEQFVYVTSHDLKTPVRGIGGLTEMIQDDLEDYFRSDQNNPDVAFNLERILDRVTRIERLTDSIIEFSQIGHNAEQSEEIRSDALENTLRQDFKLSKEQLIFSCCAGTIFNDGRSFQRVLENLVGNAIKYHDRPDEVLLTVTIIELDDRLDVIVCDNGPGIAQEFHQKVFEPFQTLSGSSAPDSTGIGLASVKKCVELHGYEIDLHSAAGEGCTFSFSWPRNDVPQGLNLPKAA